MRAFVHAPPAARVVFGLDTLARLGAEVERLGARRALVLSTPGQAETANAIAAALGARAAGVHARARMHVPIEAAHEARAEAARLGADALIAFGGGSAIGLGKAVALEADLPMLAVPTTYAGSEMTTIWGLTENGVKRTGRDPRVQPKTVLYDPMLTLDLPSATSVTSACNALAHAAEGLYAPDGSPLTALMAEQAIRALAAALPAIVADPRDVEARAAALCGAWLAGSVLGQVSMGLHHKLCHTLGGAFDLPHAETHAVVLPHVLAYNAAAAPDAMAAIVRALAVGDAGAGDDPPSAARRLFDLQRRLGAPASLRDIGMAAGDLERAVDLASRQAYANPRPFEPSAVRSLLQRAFEGSPPD